jgi:hypothetical protein
MPECNRSPGVINLVTSNLIGFLYVAYSLSCKSMYGSAASNPHLVLDCSVNSFDFNLNGGNLRSRLFFVS